MNIIVAKKKKHQKTRTLSSAEKSQFNSVASCIRFSKDRLEEVQKTYDVTIFTSFPNG